MGKHGGGGKHAQTSGKQARKMAKQNKIIKKAIKDAGNAIEPKDKNWAKKIVKRSQAGSNGGTGKGGAADDMGRWA